MTPQIALEAMKKLLGEQLENTPENAERINNAISKHSGQIRDIFFRALLRSEKDRRIPSASSLGKCTRQLAYGFHGVKGDDIDYRGRLTFAYGDILEVLVYIFLDIVGANLTDAQKRIVEGDITGSPDGALEDTVIDIKSMSDYAFDKSVEQGVDNAFGYETQLNIYRKALNKLKLGWFGIKKSKGDIGYFEGTPKPFLVDVAQKKLEIVKNSTLDNLPARDYQLEAETHYKKPTGKFKLAMQCKFCPHKSRCWNITSVAEGYNGSEVYYASGPNNSPINAADIVQHNSPTTEVV